MDRVRVALTELEMRELRAFLSWYCCLHDEQDMKSRYRTAAKYDRATHLLIPLLCVRLLVKLNMASIMVKKGYKLSLPAEWCLALLAAWDHAGRAAERKLSVGHATLAIGRIDQVLS